MRRKADVPDFLRLPLRVFRHKKNGGNATVLRFIRRFLFFQLFRHIHDLADAVEIVGIVIVDVDPSLAVVADQGNFGFESMPHPLDQVFQFDGNLQFLFVFLFCKLFGRGKIIAHAAFHVTNGKTVLYGVARKFVLRVFRQGDERTRVPALSLPDETKFMTSGESDKRRSVLVTAGRLLPMRSASSSCVR